MKYSASGASRLTGVPANTLRTWERRYGVPRPMRTSAGRRLYDERDLAAIRRMAALIQAGVPAAQAAESAWLEEADTLEAPAPAPSLHPEALELLAAASRFDERGMRTFIGSAVGRLSWGGSLTEVVFPALREVGLRWQRADVSLTHEHFLSQVVRSELLAAVRELPLPPGAPRILLACPEGERHELGVLALWLLLRQAGTPSICLGADVPAVDLVAAAARTGCDTVCLSVIATASLPHAELAARAVIAANRRLRVFVGGPALMAGDADAIPGTKLPQDIAAAAQMLAAAVEPRPD